MAKKRSGIQVGPKDVMLFRYLHSVKVATYDQIHRDVYPDICLGAAGNKIRRLEDHRLITVQRCQMFMNGKRYASITRNTFDQFVRKGGEIGLKIGSTDINHDLALGDIRNQLLKSPKIIEYQTGNDLHTWSLKYKHLDCDGIVTTRKGSSEFDAVIEYESLLSRKSNYRDFVKKYYRHGDLGLILVVAENMEIQNKIMAVEKELYPGDRPIFFYVLKQDLLANDKLQFKNFNDYVFALGDG